MEEERAWEYDVRKPALAAPPPGENRRAGNGAGLILPLPEGGVQAYLRGAAGRRQFRPGPWAGLAGSAIAKRPFLTTMSASHRPVDSRLRRVCCQANVMAPGSPK